MICNELTICDLCLYFQLQPELAEVFLAYLIKIDRLDEAAIRLAGLINDENFVSREGKSKHTVSLHLNKQDNMKFKLIRFIFFLKVSDCAVIL